MDDKAEGIPLSVLWFVIDNYRRITMKDSIIKVLQGFALGIFIWGSLSVVYVMTTGGL